MARTTLRAPLARYMQTGSQRLTQLKVSGGKLDMAQDAPTVPRANGNSELRVAGQTGVGAGALNMN